MKKSGIMPKNRNQLMRIHTIDAFNNRWFVLGYAPVVRNIRNLALDRIISIEPDTGNKYVENIFFNPDSYFGEMVGVTREVKSRPQEVILKIDPPTAPYIETKPLHVSQQIIERYADGSVRVSLSIIPNLELQRLLLGFCNHIEVVSPSDLRAKIAAHLSAAAQIYAG